MFVSKLRLYFQTAIESTLRGNNTGWDNMEDVFENQRQSEPTHGNSPGTDTIYHKMTIMTFI